MQRYIFHFFFFHFLISQTNGSLHNCVFWIKCLTSPVNHKKITRVIIWLLFYNICLKWTWRENKKCGRFGVRTFSAVLSGSDPYSVVFLRRATGTSCLPLSGSQWDGSCVRPSSSIIFRCLAFEPLFRSTLKSSSPGGEPSLHFHISRAEDSLSRSPLECNRRLGILLDSRV